MNLLDDLKNSNGKLLIIGEENCPGCEMVKTIFKEEIEKGVIEYREVDKDKEARELAKKLGIKYVPFPVYGEKGELYKCDIRQEGDEIVVECKEKIEVQ